MADPMQKAREAAIIAAEPWIPEVEPDMAVNSAIDAFLAALSETHVVVEKLAGEMSGDPTPPASSK